MTVQPLRNNPDSSAPGAPAVPGHPAGRWQPLQATPRSRWPLVAGLVVVLAVIGVGAYLLLKPAKPAGPAAASEAVASSNILTVTTVVARAQPMPRTMLVTGSLGAWDELPIGTQTSGLAIVQVLVDEGDKVRAGQVLARFDDSVLRADLASKNATLREVEALATEAEANIRRAEELARTGAISTRDLDARRSAALTTKARVAVAEAARDQAAVRLAQTEIRSPTDGTVAKRNARLGAVMSAGGTELFRLIRDDRVELVAEVPEVDLRALAPGQPVQLNVNDPDGKPFVGQVRLVSPIVDPRTRLGEVKIALPASPVLRPGMFVSGIVEVGQVSAPTVPEPAIIYRDAKAFVFSIEKEADTAGHRTVHAREIAAGGRADGKVAIIAGLNPDEEVVLSGAGYLREGDKVSVATEPVGGDIRPLPQQ